MPSQIYFIQHKFDHYFIHEDHSKEALNHHKLCEIVITPLSGTNVDSAFHPSEVDQMSTRNFWELTGER